MHKTIRVPAFLRKLFLGLRGLLRGEAIDLAVAGRQATLKATKGWYVRVGSDRQSIDLAGSVSLSLPLSPAERSILMGEAALPLGGAAVRLTQPLTVIASPGSVEDDSLKLPAGVRVELDGLPDPIAHSIEVHHDGTASVQLSARVLGVPVAIQAHLIPTT